MSTEAAIYVVVAADDLSGHFLKRALEEDPGRQPNPIAFETNINNATLASARQRASSLEKSGYGPCRVARLVFEDHPAFNEGA